MERPKFLLVANPKAGGGHAPRAARAARDLLLEHGCDVELHETRAAGDARQRMHGLVDAGIVGVGAVGGDGTLGEVVCGLRESQQLERVAVGILPAGSGNSAALDLGWTTVEEGARRMAAGTTRAIDLVRVTLDGTARQKPGRGGAVDRSMPMERDMSADGKMPVDNKMPVDVEMQWAVSMVAWGGAARINRRAEKLRFCVRWRYDLAAIWEVIAHRHHGTQARFDGAVDEHNVMIVAANTQHTGRGMRLAPEAQLDDGLLDLIAIGKGSAIGLFRVLGNVYRGRHLASPLVEARRAAGFTLELDPGTQLVIDGEQHEPRTARVDVEPGVLRVYA